MRRAAVVLITLLGCATTNDVAPAGSPTVLAGVGISEVQVGQTYAVVRAKLGDAETVGSNRLVFARYPSRGLELVFASTEAPTLKDDSFVVAVGVQRGATCEGTPCPGQARDAIEAALGAADDLAGTNVFYARGLSVTYGADNKASQVSAFAPYAVEGAPKEMTAAPEGPAPARPAVDPKRIGVVDMHLHPGKYGRIPSATKALFVEGIPAFARPYAPGVSAAALDPYGSLLGVRDQASWAGVSHAVLFAVYTQKTTGFYTNEDLYQVLTSPENRAPDGLPWAWGLASVNFFDGFTKADGTIDEGVARSRYAALASYFERRPDLFIGIKLAHPHQQIALDDARFLGVYDVARKAGVPVYLHTGFSPFPTAKNVPESYDPANFEGVLRSYPEVTFVLGHVGQGDMRSVEHALDLAKRYPNVALEISALGRPFLKDQNGNDLVPDPQSPQLPYVLAEAKTRGLVSRLLFGSDGPQFSGMIKGYVENVRANMVKLGYSDEEQAAVFGGTFARVFFGAR